MVIDCEEVWREVSNYLEGESGPAMCAAIEDHLRGCKRCVAVVNGTRNIIRLYGEERIMEVRAGYSERLRHRLETSLPLRRGTLFGWMVAFAAAAMLLVAFEIGSSSAFTRPYLRSAHAQPAARAIPADLAVVVTDEAKIFHLPGCGVIHHRSTERTLTAAEAEREGYVPCVRCLRKYVNVTRSSYGTGAAGLPGDVPSNAPAQVLLFSHQ
ncbi:MAG: zf-HC2 domain-containing protein [Acidobacteria bacterium]|nr:zf-HC2 domain-containing protein [Acidobacteriota bacterium]MBV9482607.1 zf-HC2 domain-containing protein [Acidobacteriota bacterium]